MHTALLVVHMIISVVLIVLVLIQRGKGADMGAAFGSGASGTVFGSQGSANFLTRTTAALATMFFVTSLSLAFLSVEQREVQSVTDLPVPAAPVGEAQETAPVPSQSPRPADVPVAPGD